MQILTKLAFMACAAGALAGAPGSRFNPYRLEANDLSRRRRACVAGVDYGPGIGKPEDVGCVGNGNPAEGGAESGTQTAGGQATPRSTSPHAAAMLGQVGKATVAVSQADKDSGKFTGTGATGGIDEDIFGPFEAGFGEQQAAFLTAFGCANAADGYIDGGADTLTFNNVLKKGCNIELPRWEGDKYISILDQCGGHTKDYHFHESLICLYDAAQSGHSTKVGEALDGKPIYGKYEDTNMLPLLDACSAHFGATPDSTSEIYHYHVQDAPPFVVGCFGPNDDESLVTVAQCREFYTGCGDGDEQSFTTAEGTFKYDMWCPCFDQNGKNFGTIEELAVFGPGGNTTGVVTLPPSVVTPPPPSPAGAGYMFPSVLTITAVAVAAAF